jgi:hypothetical protein
MNITDAIPTITGRAGAAWDVLTTVPNKTFTVACWIIRAPYAHPIWHDYVLSVIHLRPDPVHPEPLLYEPGVTHELTLQALDPAVEPTTTGPWRALNPLNFAAQIKEPDDAAAAQRAKAAVQEVVDGVLSPDTDFIRMWIDRFGSNMVRGR